MNRKISFYPVLIFLALIALDRGADAAPQSRSESEDDAPLFEVISDYKGNIAGSKEALAWYGERTALVLDDETDPKKYDPKIMQAILKTLDETFDTYDEVTGRQPQLSNPLRGRIRVEVSSSVGGGLAHHGRLGVAVGDGFFKGLYQRYQAGRRDLDQIFFYEIARNYWMSDMSPPIDYHTSAGEQDYGWWTVGFNNAMSVFLPAEMPTISDMHYFGQSGKQFADGMEAKLITYLQNPDKYNWDNSWNVRLLPWRKKPTSLNDLMTGTLIRMHREFGGIEFIKGLYEHIPELEPLKSRGDTQGARDNFYIASCLAAKKDIYPFFTKQLRWEISKRGRSEARKRLKKQKAELKRKPALSLVPWPHRIKTTRGKLALSQRSRILFETRTNRKITRDIERSLEPLANVLAEELEMLTGMRLAVLEKTDDVQPKVRDIVLSFSRLGSDFAETEAEEDQRYMLKIAEQGISISSRYYKGVAYGTATLLQTLQESSSNKFSFPFLTIDDRPVAGFRNVLLDVARRPISIGVIEDVIRLARMYKVRYVQLHLTDDQAFTFPFAPIIDGLKAKEQRNYAYTRQEMEDLVAYADARGVTLIPELELPGHSTKIMQSGYLSPLDKNHGQIADPRNYEKLNAIIDDILSVFKNSPYFHMGGDESGAGSALVPLVQSINKHVRANPPGGKRRLVVWEGFHGSPTEQIPATGDDRVIVVSWESKYNTPWNLLSSGYSLVNACWKPTYVVGQTGNRRFDLVDLYRWDKDRFMHWEPGLPVTRDAGPNDDKVGDSEWDASFIGCESQMIGGQLLLWEMVEEGYVERLRQRVPVMSERLWNPNTNKPFDEYETRAKAADSVAMTIVQPVEILPYEYEPGSSTDPNHPKYYFDLPRTAADTQITMRNRSKIPGTIRYSVSSEPENLNRTVDPVTAESSAYQGEKIDASAGRIFRAKLFRNDGTIVGGDTWKRSRAFVKDAVRFTEFDPEGKFLSSPIPDLAKYPGEKLVREFTLPFLSGNIPNTGFRLQKMDSILTVPQTAEYVISVRAVSGTCNIRIDLNQDGKWQADETVIKDTPLQDERFKATVRLEAGKRYWYRLDHASGLPRSTFSPSIDGPGIDRKGITPFLSLPTKQDKEPRG